MNAWHHRRAGSLASTIMLILVLNGCAETRHTDSHAPSPMPKPEGTAEDSRSDVDVQRLAALVDRTLPTWDESVLSVQDGKDWTGTLDFRRVSTAMGDELSTLNELPAGITEVSDKERSLRVVPHLGKVRYVNRSRAWDPTKGLSKAVEERQAVAVVHKALVTLGLPVEELSDVRVNTQIAAGAPAGSPRIREQFEMARIVTIPRKMGRLPVYNSRVLAAVANEGIIERFQASWPTFRLMKELTLMDRGTVVKQVAEHVARQQPDPAMKMQAYLAYAPASADDEDVQFVPAVIVSVYAKPTPYQLVVPVAQGEGARDRADDKERRPERDRIR